MAKVVLVTGCRSGFGLLTAVAAARAGWVVYAGLRDPATGGALTAATPGLPVHLLALDVTRPAERRAAVERILAEAGRLDALVNNAGQALGGFLEQVEEEELRALFDVNVFGAFALTQACLPALRAAGRATVVMVSSMSGRFAFPALGAYAASKFALEGLSEAWRHELAPFGVRLVLVEPGAYRTDIFGRNRNLCRNARDPASPYAPWIDGVDRLFARLTERMARDPQEVADLIVRLLDEPRPALRYPCGPSATPRALALKLLPFRAIELVLGRVLAQARRPAST